MFHLLLGNPRQSWVTDPSLSISDSRHWILVKLGFWIPIVSGISDSLSCFLDFKA